MNKRQKEVIQSTLDEEQEVLDALQRNYATALADVKRNIKELQSNPLTQSKAYQLEFQQQLEKQISGILDNLQGKNFTSIADYLNSTYRTSFIGNVYDMQGQGVPLVLAIDERQVLKAVQKTGDDFKLSNKLGVSTKLLKQQVQQELIRGLASQLSYSDIARNISDYGEADYNRSARIARTEGHRVQNEAKIDSMNAASKKGANIVKQWDSTLDGLTRDTHRELDGQIHELDEPFEVAGKKAMMPGAFGDPSEDCNCRCCILQRARWALKEGMNPDTGEVTYSEKGEYQKWNNETGGFIQTTGFADFQSKYLKAVKNLQTPSKSVIIRNYQGNMASKLGSEYYDHLHDIIDSCPDGAAVDVWGKYEDSIGVAETSCSRTAYCDRGGNIHIDATDCAKGNSYDAPYQTVFHESGHAIDVKARQQIQGGSWGASHFSAAYEGGKFPSTIKSEVSSWVDSVSARMKAEFKEHSTDLDWLLQNGYIDSYTKSYFMTHGSWGWMGEPKFSKSMAYKAIEKEIRLLPQKARADLSDILEGATGGKISCGFGHGKKYWVDRTIDGVPDGLATEAFAEMMDSTFASPDSLETIKKYLPNSYGVFEDMLKFLMKG